MSISNKVEQVILGSILGDSHIRNSKNYDKARLEFSHSEKQVDYIKHKRDLLSESIEVSELRECFINKKFRHYRFQTRYNSDLTHYRKMFYDDKVKIIKKSMLNKLQPLALAIWYMDDGNKILHLKKDGSVKSRELAINTQCFTYEEHKILQDYFYKNWNIKFNIYKNKSSYRLVCGAREANKFIEIIEPYIIDSMKYKIDLQYSK